MSRETMQWLNTMTLIGFTEKRGNAWHYKRELQEGQGNHFEGPVPVHAVNDLFFDAVEGYAIGEYLSPDGVVQIRDERRKVMLRPPGTFGPDDRGGILSERLLDGQPGADRGWNLHQFKGWLVNTLGDIIDTPSSDLGIASAGLLRAGSMAWVQVEAPENVETAVGFTFRPFILAATAHTGSMSTTFKRCMQAVVCDNTLDIGLSEAGETHRIQHTRNSSAKLLDVRETLGIIHTMADDFAAQVEALADITVSDGDFEQFLNMWAPLEKDGKRLEGRSLALAEGKQKKLVSLYRHDNRVTPWGGSALGVLQAVNTFEHHVQGTTGKSGPDIAQRNMLKVVQGTRGKSDRDAVSLIREIVEPATA